MIERSRELRRALTEPSYFLDAVRLPAQAFIHTEQTGAIVLLLAAAAAMGWVNSPWSESYFNFWHTTISFDVFVFSVSEDLEHLVNDGLMAVFFFVVGLEIKRELMHGELTDFRKAVLPAAAAVGGMVTPALIYFAFNGTGEGAAGWGIPIATDIAFALGVLGLLGRSLPSQLRIFLLGLAVADDLGRYRGYCGLLHGDDPLDRSRPCDCPLSEHGRVHSGWHSIDGLLCDCQHLNVAVPAGIWHPRHPGRRDDGGNHAVRALSAPTEVCGRG